ncbi:hypothetical protein [Iningainema tapete]|uniref:Uncharacterized protein n=1 Tax=Iningainema tapete BLCC-T55 TaxID=2748662 RepID=A0A8J6XQA3_9CYAN|nr:hypothetical protein [Iningainema tapete]MBD2777552.1 hypothetical protein [Iningainema tapete BLCC-T55]
MRPFIDRRKTAIGEEVGVETSKSYIECEYPIDEDTVFVVYIIPRNENSAWLVTSFEHVFDELVSNIDEQTSETIADTWPTLASLLYNGIKDRYQEGALLVLEDSDYCENKWFVASIAGNISFETLEDLFGERIQQAVQLVISKSMTLWIELSENRPDILREIWKGFLKGLSTAVAATVFAFLGIDSEQ